MARAHTRTHTQAGIHPSSFTTTCHYLNCIGLRWLANWRGRAGRSGGHLEPPLPLLPLCILGPGSASVSRSDWDAAGVSRLSLPGALCPCLPRSARPETDILMKTRGGWVWASICQGGAHAGEHALSRYVSSRLLCD